MNQKQSLFDQNFDDEINQDAFRQSLKISNHEIQKERNSQVNNIQIVQDQIQNQLQTIQKDEQQLSSSEDLFEDIEDESTKKQEIPQMLTKRLSFIPSKQSNLNLSGWLQKKHPTFFFNWEWRYCILDQKKFSYRKTDKHEKADGYIDFDLISCELFEIKDKNVVTGFSLKCKNIKKLFTFRVDPKYTEQIGVWIQSLKTSIINSIGFKKGLCELAKVEKFWKNDRISQQKFKMTADTGDILLFRTKDAAANIQRTFTRSEFDHVGLIIRYSSGQIFLFEATGQQGVGLTSWKTFMKNKWHLLYSKMVLRSLNVERNYDMVTTLEKFIKGTLGNKYGISIKKLKSKESTQFSQKDDNLQGQTFFCSELVAAAYKKLGYLDQNKSAAQYWPGSFSHENKLQLLNGTTLGGEQLIDFSI